MGVNSSCFGLDWTLPDVPGQFKKHVVGGSLHTIKPLGLVSGGLFSCSIGIYVFVNTAPSGRCVTHMRFGLGMVWGRCVYMGPAGRQKDYTRVAGNVKRYFLARGRR